jgi:hypothetical protein
MKTYNSSNANCQHFVDEIIYFLGLSRNISFGGQMAEFLKNVKEKGTSELKYKIPKELIGITNIKLDSNIIHFNSHQELDKFVNEINIGISNNDKEEYKEAKELKDLKDFKDDYLVILI